MIEKQSKQNLIVLKPTSTRVAANAKLANDEGVATVGLDTLGLFGKVVGSSNPIAVANADMGNYRELEFIYRRDTSKDRSPLPMMPFIKSGKISKDCGFTITGTNANTAESSQSWFIGGNTATTKVQVGDELNYAINAAHDGSRVRMFYSEYTNPSIRINYTSPDYTVDFPSYTEADKRADVLSKLAHKYNQFSLANNAYSLVFAISFDQAQGQTATIINGLALGTQIQVGIAESGEPFYVTLTAGLKNTLIAAMGKVSTELSASPANVSLVTYNALDNTYANERPDGLLFIANDLDKAYFDEVYVTKTQLYVGTEGTLATAKKFETTAAKELVGASEYIKKLERDIFNLNYPSGKQQGSMFIEYPSNVVDGTFYDLITVEHCVKRTATSGFPSISTQVTLIAIPTSLSSIRDGLITSLTTFKA